MAEIRALFWDIGGVLLTNAWDHEERDQAIARFQLEKTELEARHKELFVAFEEGKFSLDEYLERAVFYKPRTFTAEEFKEFMRSLSKPNHEALEIARGLSAKYPMATINNESREFNEYRIRTFGLRNCFHVFVSSCYVGVRKPGERIYRLALDLTQRSAEECCFIDDRPVNIEGAAKVGMQTVLMQNADQLRNDLKRLGVKV